MRYVEPSLKNAKRDVVGVVWSRIWRPIFYAVSVVSLVGNALLLAESLELRAAIVDWLPYFLPRLRDGTALLLQRPILFLLLNIIMFGIVFKSGVLAAPALNRFQGTVQNRVMPGLISGEQQRRSSSHLRIPQFQDDYYYEDDEDTDQRNSEQFACDGVQERTNGSGREINNVMEAHAVLDTEEPPATELEKTTSKDSNTVRRTRVVAEPKPKPASLFTIEPLRELTHYGKVDQNMKVFHNDIEQETNVELPSSTSMRDDPVPSHWYHVPPRDYELSPQELNARADGFITKFKRNLTMQREDSFNRLRALAGKK